MNRPVRRVLPLAMSALLAACASVPPQAPRTPPAAIPPVSAQLPQPPVTATVPAPAPAQATNVWDKLRDSFAMPGCDADPAVLAWAKRYTRNPDHFESTLRRALPRLDYVQQAATQYRVPGEFVLLPWVESHYRPVAARRHRPAGMWQIMPVTARSLKLRVNRHYDGRLDMPAATHAVMKLLARYHDRFDDWRLADYAYNAGEFGVRKLIREHGAPPDRPVIPHLPVRKVTREHLVKLLAMACVVREPERFHVNLPVLPDTERLVQAPLPHSMTYTRAAGLADIPVATLKQLNPAFHGDTINADYSSYLMLPAARAEQFRIATRQAAAPEPTDSVSQTGDDARTASDPQNPRTHVVSRGESLWQIARDNQTSVVRLQQLNHLQGHTIRQGEVLQLDDVD